MSQHSWSATLETAAGAFDVRELSGHEVIGRPYRFELSLEADDPAVDGGAILRSDVTLRITAGGKERRVHGVVRTFEQGDAAGGRYAYRAEVVPRVALLDLGRESRIYQDLTAPEIVVSVLAAGGIAIADVDLRLERAHPRRRYVVQYQESPLSFLSRLLEDAAIGMSFTHDGGRERIVLCDENDGYPEAGTLCYRGREDGSTRLESVRIVRRALPARVVVSDHDVRAPHLPLQAMATVDPDGVGLYVDAATRFDDPRQGQALARLRAEELRARAATLEMTSDAPLAAGVRAPLRGHFRADVNQPLLLTEVHHRAAPSGYSAQCSALFADVPHRPARRTPRPRLHGVSSARVDASRPGASTAVDEEGAYRVVMPFDLSGAEEGRATAPMWLAQPHGGPDQGLHFAIPKGAEVLWTCIDGDPDRPVITAVVPSAGAPSLVTGDNAESTILRGRGGASLELRGPAPRSSSLVQQQQHATDVGHQWQESSAAGDPGRDTWFKIHVPHTAACSTANAAPRAVSYVRYGEEPLRDEEPARLDPGRHDWLKAHLHQNQPDPRMSAHVDSTALPSTIVGISGGQTLELKVDGGPVRTVTFPSSGLFSAATLGGGQEVWEIQALVTTLDDLFAAAQPPVEAHATVSGDKVRISTKSCGSPAKIQIVGGTANATLEFPTAAHRGKDGDPYSDAPDAAKSQWRTSGVFDYTDRNRTVVTRGHVEELIEGTKTETIMGSSAAPGTTEPKPHSKTFYADDEEGWRVLSAKAGAFTDLTGGYKEFFTAGFAYTGTVGGAMSATLAVKADFSVAASVASNVGLKADFFVGGAYSFKKDYAVDYAKTFDKKAEESISLEVGSATFKATTKPQIITAIAASSAAVVGGLVGSALALESVLDETEATAHIGSSVAAGSATLAATALTIMAAVDYARSKLASKSLAGSDSKTKLKLSEAGILLDGEPMNFRSNSVYLNVGATSKKITLSVDDNSYVQIEAGKIKLIAPDVFIAGNVTIDGSVQDGSGARMQLATPGLAKRALLGKGFVKGAS